jgi:hypothetical protein
LLAKGLESVALYEPDEHFVVRTVGNLPRFSPEAEKPLVEFLSFALLLLPVGLIFIVLSNVLSRNAGLGDRLARSLAGVFELIAAKIPPVEFVQHNMSMIGMLAFYVGLFFLLDYFFGKRRLLRKVL